MPDRMKARSKILETLSAFPGLIGVHAEHADTFSCENGLIYVGNAGLLFQNMQMTLSYDPFRIRVTFYRVTGPAVLFRAFCDRFMQAGDLSLRLLTEKNRLKLHHVSLSVVGLMTESQDMIVAEDVFMLGFDLSADQESKDVVENRSV